MSPDPLSFSPVDGRISFTALALGRQVEAGDLLVRLENDEERARLARHVSRPRIGRILGSS